MLLEIKGLETEIPTRGRIVRPARGLDLSLRHGECLGIAGESGCGKTMLLLSIMRLLPPGARVSSGAILFEGEDLVNLSQAKMRSIRGRRIALVFQEPTTALNPVFTIGSQLTESIRLHDRANKKAADARAAELLSDMRITDPTRRLSQYPHELSGGMRQRVMLAIAIASKPSVVLADEPTSSLDVTVQAEIIALLAGLRARYGLSLIFVSHDLALLSQLCDRIAVMYLGRVVEAGTAEEIVASPLHPYTRALLACVPPLPGRDDHRIGASPASFQEIPGELPDGAVTIPGCQFHPRCQGALPRCRDDSPTLDSPTQTHQVACFMAKR
ncbi:MAG: ABC transporter ATP-binding protein [Candidatus Coatesbacteria bacterium]|nr:ABC transporter ATP-binding protein [Candidatus Coatesbacteria bacterium]